MPRRLILAILLLLAIPAHAVIVRGRVTSPLGQPLAGARVQLIRLTDGSRSVADAISGIDGAYEMRTDLSGRFLLLASPSVNSPEFAPLIGYPFYAGRADILTLDVALNASSITPQTSSHAALMETPLPQLSVAPTQVAADQLLTQATLLPELRPIPGAFVVEQGQTGTPATLYLRGAPVTRTVIDGVSAEELGGRFNLTTIGGGLGAIASSPALELTPTANPLYAVDSGSGVLSLATPIAETMHPVFTYAGDAGGLSTVRNEGKASVAHSRADALVSFARLNTDNDLPAKRLHLVSLTANFGYYISAATSLRLTLRDDVSAAPLPSPFSFFGVAPATKLATQNLYGGFTFETRTAGNWHNLVRYGLVRERAQAHRFTTPASGLPVTITGANGYSASGVASFIPASAREDAVTDRDEYTWQSDYPFRSYLTGLLTARYQNERGADLTSAQTLRLTRNHFSVAAAVQGEIHHRFFYAASGFLDRSPTYGFSGAPRLGLTYVPVRPGVRRFRGTSLHLTAATGTREPSVIEASFLAEPRSRTLDFSVDQTILAKTLLLRATYFHNQFSHEFEPLAVNPILLSNALAYRTQGFESDLRYQPFPRVLLHGGYTYLAALVERSSATASYNPAFPGIPIGGLTALAGSRPFQRPPNTGFLAAEYSGPTITASIKATFAGKSDDTTGLILNPALLLPNRNLSPGYAAVDANIAYNVTHAITLYTQLNNLLDDRHIAPIGYLSTPFLARVGVRLRLGRE